MLVTLVIQCVFCFIRRFH